MNELKWKLMTIAVFGDDDRRKRKPRNWFEYIGRSGHYVLGYRQHRGFKSSFSYSIFTYDKTQTNARKRYTRFHSDNGFDSLDYVLQITMERYIEPKEKLAYLEAL